MAANDLELGSGERGCFRPDLSAGPPHATLAIATLLQRMSRKTGSRSSGRTSAVRSPQLRRTEPGAQVQHLQRTVGNRATARWLHSQLIQPTLTVGRAGDKYEREADRVADEVMRMPDLQEPTSIQRAPLTIQRVCQECEEERQRRSAPDEEEEGVLQAKSAGASEPPGPTPGLESYFISRRRAALVNRCPCRPVICSLFQVSNHLPMVKIYCLQSNKKKLRNSS